MPTPPTVLGVPIASLVGSNLASKFLPATLTKYSPGTYDINNPSSGLQKVPTNYKCRALVTKHTETLAKNEQTRVLTGEISVLTSTIAGKVAIAEGDHITMQWPDGQTYVAYVTSIGLDPAGALAICKVNA